MLKSSSSKSEACSFASKYFTKIHKYQQTNHDEDQQQSNDNALALAAELNIENCTFVNTIIDCIKDIILGRKVFFRNLISLGSAL